MKKSRLIFLLPLLLLPMFSGCGKTDYSAYISEAKEDVFVAQTETFQITLSCVTREYPYVSDGIPSPGSRIVEISLTSEAAPASYEVYVLGETQFGGEMTFRTYASDYFFSQSVQSFFKDSVSVRVQRGDESVEVVATSVKNENTLSVKQALGCAVKEEKDLIDAMTGTDGFQGEFYVRLLRRDANYYYVGIIDRNGGVLSLLLDGESGEVLAKRKTQG